MALISILKSAISGFLFFVALGFVLSVSADEQMPERKGVYTNSSDTGWIQMRHKQRRYDIYLVGGRICYKCIAQLVDGENVRLTDAQQHWTIVPMRDVLGYDRHPALRKLMIKSLYGIGKAGPDLVPYAFENAQDYVCKYCGSLD